VRILPALVRAERLLALVRLVAGNGEVAGPVRNLRFTQGYPQALGPGRVLGIGRCAVTQPTHGFGYQSYRAPALRLASWRFTGGAEG